MRIDSCLELPAQKVFGRSAADAKVCQARACALSFDSLKQARDIASALFRPDAYAGRVSQRRVNDRHTFSICGHVPIVLFLC
ncbi:MAG: hypothetical protein DMF68_11085 [Acidobacteria bacterium]|nr:MAG: hypothetical protein DMF68_11085 [Acidobacteriota bacterium]